MGKEMGKKEKKEEGRWEGCLTSLVALMISRMRGTPSVMFIDWTPAKWKL